MHKSNLFHFKTQYLFFFSGNYGNADSVSMMLGEAVHCAFKIVTNMRGFKTLPLPVADLVKSGEHIISV